MPYLIPNLDPPLNNVSVLPAKLVAQSANGAVLAAGLEAQHTKCLRHDHALLVVVWWRDTLEGLQTLHGRGATGSLVRDHATHSTPEHLRWCTVVPWT